MSKPWPRVKLGDVLTPVQRDDVPTAGTLYRQIGVRLWGEGAYERESIDGSQTKYAKLFQAKTGDVIVNKIWARNGSVAVVDASLDGTWGSAEFPLFESDQKVLNSRWMHWVTKAPWFWQACDEQAQGTSGKNRIKPEQFLGIEIPLPPIDAQRRIVARIDAVQQQLQQANKLRSSIDHDIASLLAVRFQETLQHAEWRPMREVAPLVRREVKIHPEKMYSELGIRSFYKGAFARRTISGAEFTWQKLYKIKAEDLIFSNIMAWEKGIALAEPEHDGCVGNHRMLTCEAVADKALSAYLSYYFTTEAGFAKVYAASPGTAARNRTLTADSLMAITVPTPPIHVQRQFTELQLELSGVLSVKQDEAILSEAVTPALISHIFSKNSGGGINAK